MSVKRRNVNPIITLPISVYTLFFGVRAALASKIKSIYLRILYSDARTMAKCASIPQSRNKRSPMKTDFPQRFERCVIVRNINFGYDRLSMFMKSVCDKLKKLEILQLKIIQNCRWWDRKLWMEGLFLYVEKVCEEGTVIINFNLTNLSMGKLYSGSQGIYICMSSRVAK
jgi:hypothetical protein